MDEFDRKLIDDYMLRPELQGFIAKCIKEGFEDHKVSWLLKP